MLLLSRPSSDFNVKELWNWFRQIEPQSQNLRNVLWEEKDRLVPSLSIGVQKRGKLNSDRRLQQHMKRRNIEIERQINLKAHTQVGAKA